MRVGELLTYMCICCPLKLAGSWLTAATAAAAAACWWCCCCCWWCCCWGCCWWCWIVVAFVNSVAYGKEVVTDMGVEAGGGCCWCCCNCCWCDCCWCIMTCWKGACKEKMDLSEITLTTRQQDSTIDTWVTRYLKSASICLARNLSTSLHVQMMLAYSDNLVTVTLWPVPKGVTVSGDVCISQWFSLYPQYKGKTTAALGGNKLTACYSLCTQSD